MKLRLVQVNFYHLPLSGIEEQVGALKRAQEQAAREGRSFQEVLLLFLCFSDIFYFYLCNRFSVHPVEKLLLFC
jgi:hypothetical protein